jgi:tetratricopeptide (TPR) repeat protein
MLTAPAAAHPGHPSDRNATSAKITQCLSKLERDPKLYPVHAELGEAYLRMAQQTGDPAYLADARAALRRSLGIQPSLFAFKTLAAVCNYSHRFDDACRWGQEALRAAPHDTGVLALMMEAYLARGNQAQALALLGPLAEPARDFYSAAARGHYAKAVGRQEDAESSFRRAADLARESHAADLTAWATVQAAAVWLDAGEPARAEPWLQAAEKLAPTDVNVRIHRAEWWEAHGEHGRALELYEAALADGNDPQLHAKAFAAAHKAGQEAKAEMHFAAAEQGFQRAIDAGEVYTLGAFARLLWTAGKRLDEALSLCQKNLAYQSDAASRELCESIQTKAAEHPHSSP